MAERASLQLCGNENNRVAFDLAGGSILAFHVTKPVLSALRESPRT